ncbi:MAG: cupin domain-containing protein [Pyrinomonadaceae bacterium]
MAKLDFSYLIDPIRTPDFFEQYWEKSQLLIKRDKVNRYQSLIDATQTADILSLADQLPAAAVDLIGTIRTNKTAVESTNALADLFGKGATIRIRGIDRFCEPLGELCRNLEQEVGAPVRTNLYCTPGSSHAFNLHFDTHEVFILQLLGKKQWQVFEPTTRLPLEFVPRLPFENDSEALQRFCGVKKAGENIQSEINEEELGPPAIEALLEPGDCLYLPRGFVHQAAAQVETSVHLTIGIHVLTWLDLLSVALGQSAQRNEDFRRALPVGLFHEPGNANEFEREFDERLQLFARDAAFSATVNEIAESFAIRSAKSPIGKRDAVGLVDRDTKLEGNGQLRFYLADDGTMAGLACDEKEFWLPVGFAPALRFVSEGRVFRPLEIPGSISENGKVTFVRHLLKDGFLRLAQ